MKEDQLTDYFVTVATNEWNVSNKLHFFLFGRTMGIIIWEKESNRLFLNCIQHFSK